MPWPAPDQAASRLTESPPGRTPPGGGGGRGRLAASMTDAAARVEWSFGTKSPRVGSHVVATPIAAAGSSHGDRIEGDQASDPSARATTPRTCDRRRPPARVIRFLVQPVLGCVDGRPRRPRATARPTPGTDAGRPLGPAPETSSSPWPYPATPAGWPGASANPSCWSMLSWSITAQCSTVMPSTNREMWTCCQVADLPDGGMPANSPFMVP